MLPRKRPIQSTDYTDGSSAKKKESMLSTDTVEGGAILHSQTVLQTCFSMETCSRTERG